MSAGRTRILVVDDEPAIRRLLRTGLATQDYEVAEAADGEAALLALEAGGLDLVVLDLGLPVRNGLDVLRTLRERGDLTPVVVLSSRDDEAGKVQALDDGADDYVTKPFGVEELLARVRAAVRRSGDVGRQIGTVRTDHFTLDFSERRATVEHSEIRLTPTEFRLLATLLARPGEVVRRRELIAAAWPVGAVVQANTLDSYMRRLRRLLEQVDPEERLSTARGVGFRLG